MPPVALLFSSDGEMSCRLVQALEDLELEVEPCPDVFTAVEWLISRSFDVIVADCDSGPEAGFLLKNARDLKLNKAAFTLALTSDSQQVPTDGSAADLVLTKPLTPDEIKYALLGNDRFLVCMKSWIGQGDIAQAPQRSAPSPALPATHLDPPFLQPAGTTENGLAAATRPDEANGSRRRNKFQGVVIMTITFACAGYLMVRRPAMIHGVVGKVSTAYKQARAKIFDDDSDGDNTRPNFTNAADADFEVPAVARSSASRGRVGTHSTTTIATPATEAQTEAEADQDQTADARIQIPESLRAPPSDAAIRVVSVKHPVSLLGQIEPVPLSEESSRALLLENVQPSYPEQAMKAGLQGPVVLQAWIGRDGSVRELKLVNGSFLLAKAAVSAVKQWRYRPYVRNGVAVEAQTYVTVNFKLP